MKSITLKFTVIIILASILMASSVLNENKINPIKIVAEYDGFDDMGYSFSYTLNEETETITFEEVKEELIKRYDLETDNSVGKKFEVTYSIREVDEDEDEDTVELILNNLKIIE